MIKFAKPQITQAEHDAVKTVMNSGIFVHGSNTNEFEEEFKTFTGAPVSLSYANCTLALQAAHWHAKQSRSISDGSEVICPAMSHVATSNAIEMCGLTPVYCDCNASGNIDVSAIERLINKKTVGITLVHFNGIPADMHEVRELAKKHHLYVVEDCAIALGARFNNKHVGLIGDYGCFSFHPVKQMTTGEGGMLISQHVNYEHDLRLQRAFGVTREFHERKIPGHYDVSCLGTNYRMAEIPSAIGKAQLLKLASNLERRRKNYEKLCNAIALNGFYNEVVCVDMKNKDRSHYCFILMLPEDVSRDDFQLQLLKAGLETSVYYPKPIPHFSFKSLKQSFPEAERIANHSIAVPVGPHLSDADVLEIIRILNTNVANAKRVG